MKIMTIGTSPYLISRGAKINSQVIKSLSKDHEVVSLVHSHDTSWYSQDEDKKFWYKDSETGEKICELYPFVYRGEKSSPIAYEAMKLFKPDVVITIGNYYELDFIYALKVLDSEKFKWVNIVTIDALPIQKDRSESLRYCDLIIAVNKPSYEELKSILPFNDIKYCNFGTDISSIKDINVDTNSFRIISCSKNVLTSNIGALLKGVSLAQKREPTIEFYLNTNISDRGDNNIEEIAERYKCNVRLPSNYSGFNDGLNINDLKSEFSKSDIVLDVSCKSAVGLTVLDAMIFGCIPIVSNTIGMKEIIEKIDERYLLGGNVLLGQKSEENIIVSSDEVSDRIIELFYIKRKDLDSYINIKERCQNVSLEYDVNKFTSFLKECLIEVINKKEEILTDNF